MKRQGRARFTVGHRPHLSLALGAIGAALIVRGIMVSLVTPLVPVAMPVSPVVAVHAPSCVGGAMQVVAHEDDDLLFQSPDLLHDVQAGRCVRTVFVTAGDAERGEVYWRSRESGSQAAYARMAGVADSWTTTDAGVPGRKIELRTLVGAPNVSLVFMHLPDGDRGGEGLKAHDRESLMRLWEGTIPSITTVDGSTTYSDITLESTLTTLMEAFGPTTIRAQDWTIPFRTGDHADHTATALLVRQASRSYPSAHSLYAYAGYPIWTRMPNVSGTDLTAKESTFLAYASHDKGLCLDPWCTDDVVYSLRLSRQYVVASESTGNSAREPGVKVTASSQATRSGQGASKAVDGYALGSPGAKSQEWATDGGGAGSWIQLDYPTATTLDGVVLADRPNLRDQVTSALLQFSDGSTVPVGALANNGSSVTIHFTTRTTTSLRLVITSVSQTTSNAGLAEIETYGNMPSDTSRAASTTAAQQ